jgi:hypothetical protein
MADLDRRISTLQEARQELLKQLDAIDKAIAALSGAQPAHVDDTIGEETVIPTRVRPKRVLGESHKEALAIGRRKARHAKDAAAGLAREMPDDSFAPAIGPTGGNQSPRLIKRRRD